MTGKKTVSRELLVSNKAGFHLRVASLICQTAGKFASDLYLINGSYRADCKSCLDLLALMAPCGTVLTLNADGPDAAQAADAFEELFRIKFQEDEFAPPKEPNP